VAASRDYAELEPVARAAAEVATMRGELESLAALDDPEMRELAEEEIARIRAELPRPNARSPSPCCRVIRPTAARPCWKSALAPGG
jgi:protein subunit release factor A